MEKRNRKKKIIPKLVSIINQSETFSLESFSSAFHGLDKTIVVFS